MLGEHVLYTVSRDKDLSNLKKVSRFIFRKFYHVFQSCDDSKFLNQNTIQC